jgi:hypothetical protein
MNRKQRERLAMIALAIWQPFDRPDDEASERAAALRRWRGEDDEDEKQSNELSDAQRIES